MDRRACEIEQMSCTHYCSFSKHGAREREKERNVQGRQMLLTFSQIGYSRIYIVLCESTIIISEFNFIEFIHLLVPFSLLFGCSHMHKHTANTKEIVESSNTNKTTIDKKPITSSNNIVFYALLSFYRNKKATRRTTATSATTNKISFRFAIMFCYK